MGKSEGGFSTIGYKERIDFLSAIGYLKERGFTAYDLGGYGVDTDDPAILAINYFKDGFKGTLVQENHFESYPFLLLKFLHKLVN